MNYFYQLEQNRPFLWYTYNRRAKKESNMGYCKECGLETWGSYGYCKSCYVTIYLGDLAEERAATKRARNRKTTKIVQDGKSVVESKYE